MIIVEGPDGSGKTTLIDQTLAQYPTLHRHSRASHGKDGPVQDLYHWGRTDLDAWPKQSMAIYDRHPFVSEYIYGPVIRGTVDPRFYHSDGRRRLVNSALVIVCLPPLEVVRASVSDERDMPGVAMHIDTIWHLYASLRATWPNRNLIFWDWTRGADLSNLFSAINYHRANWSYRVD